MVVATGSGHGWTGDVYELRGDDAAALFQNRRRGLNPAAASSSPLGLTWCRDRRKGTRPRVLRMRKAMSCHVMPLPIVSVPYRAKFLTCVLCRFADLETHTHTHTHTLVHLGECVICAKRGKGATLDSRGERAGVRPRNTRASDGEFDAGGSELARGKTTGCCSVRCMAHVGTW